MSAPAEEYAGGSAQADHLCVLVHGLWGNPNHMRNIAKALRKKYSHDHLYILLAKQNSGNFTYDGIDRGGERICAEIEAEIREIESRGGKITKLSIVGYSLGGLISRYAVGLLYAKGFFNTVKCMNFVTFASPHLGVRSPRKGWINHIWNVLGARSLSISGRQLFMIDKFRDTERPLLSVLADPNSIFMSGLREFKRRALYTNIVNDRSAVYYTTGIQKTDPYTDMDRVKVNYLKGYEGVILDPMNPSVARPRVQRPATWSTITASILKWVKRIPFMLKIALILSVGIVAFLINAVIQTIRSANRIRLHDTGKSGLKIEEYRMSIWMKEIQEEVEHAYEALNNSQNQEYLGTEDEEDEDLDAEDRSLLQRERRLSISTQPTLALTPHQFKMIDSLDSVGWRKYPVWIHNNRHSHAAIIVRMDKPSFDEGLLVLKHFAEAEFMI
ncbi:putative serine esterase-domain-containing protein [Mariannaea sp. PMI_226]|nr:putative serine esterase-domain-containing protein [Mariannaea sp. PMI_226]